MSKESTSLVSTGKVNCECADVRKNEIYTNKVRDQTKSAKGTSCTKPSALSEKNKKSEYSGSLSNGKNNARVEKTLMDHETKKEKKQCKKKKKNDQIVKDESESGEDKTVCTKATNMQKHNKQDKQKSSNLKKGGENNHFPNYISVEKITHILETQSTTDKKYVKGHLRINPQVYHYAYISVPGWDRDLIIRGVVNRNRALDGDLVVARVNRPSQEKESNDHLYKATYGTVVCILEKIHPRKVIGCLRKEKSDVIVYPRDTRLPYLKIDMKSVPKEFLAKPHLLNNTLCMASILTWKKPQITVGEIIEIIGKAGNIEAESQAILRQYDLDVTPYSQNMLKGIPTSDYVPTADDLICREDWREECVFTIDPDRATNLDDAVSCKLLDNGNYEVAVHIADVTHFLKFLSPLDIEVAKRATSVHMTDNVYHMLPSELRDLCSLTPGQDKLAFSVIWEITPEPIIISHRIVKTVIRSCCQMSYKQAQMFIQDRKKNWPDDSLNIKGPFTIHEVLKVLLSLYDLSLQLQEKRFSEGALQLDRSKFEIIVDKATGLPTSYSMEEVSDSYRLIQEFMLLANVTVANYLYETKPDAALFINNKKPSTTVLNETKSMLEKFGIHLEIDSARALQASIKRYELVLDSDSEECKKMSQYRMMVINNLLIRGMQRATYKCSSTVSEKEELSHYALNVPLYTQFTSPLQRYSDCVVHRLLQLSIRRSPLPDDWSEHFCTEIAKTCNTKKQSAKLAEDSSTKLYFIHLVELMGSITVLGIVSEVREKSLDVILCETGLKLKIYIEDVETVASVQYSTEYSVPTLTVSWKQPTVNQMITLFTLVNLRVEGDRKSNKLHGTLLPPQQVKLH